jgi:hypothetical protein
MAVDIYNARAATTQINNGTTVVNTGGRGDINRVVDTIAEGVLNTPIITDIDDKYDARFDDPTYYG